MTIESVEAKTSPAVTFDENCLSGRHVLVTGASSGLGKASAILLAKCGARLTLIGRDEARLEETRAQLEPADHSTHSIDLTDAERTADAVQALAKERGLFHGMFHSAGSTLTLPLKLLKNRHLDEVFGAGVRGAFGMVRAAAKKGVMADGGSIVIMSSTAARRGRPALGSYCAAKAAADALVRSAALELADRRIRVNSIQAAAIETAMHHEYMASISEAARAEYIWLHPLGFGQPEDVANAVTFLLSDASRWISGTALSVDGAATAK
jgi:NAD(P)-dependent dehydrogenase (short-subunit alcohol dehydrogenase family)